MPNSELYGKEFNVPGNVLFALKGSDSQRSNNIVKNGKISYSLLKRLKNIFDNNNETEEYGGDIVKNWVNQILRNNRSDVHDIKQNQMNTGMFNRFKKEHTKDKNANPTHTSGIDVTHKEFMGSGIYENKKVVRLTESQFKRLIENIIKEEEKSDVVKDLEKRWAMEDEFRRIMKDVVEKENPLNLDSIYYVDKNDNYVYIEYNQKSKYVWIDYKKLWSVFESKYDLNYVEVRDFFKGILKRDYNLRGITPIGGIIRHQSD